ncbi:tyrosine kinase receptor Cad96Ca [Trichonephila clavipes]|nr:tyrosine kinase receptor Cad96Ca [Trichonephila clavipes]
MTLFFHINTKDIKTFIITLNKPKESLQKKIRALHTKEKKFNGLFDFSNASKESSVEMVYPRFIPCHIPKQKVIAILMAKIEVYVQVVKGNDSPTLPMSPSSSVNAPPNIPPPPFEFLSNPWFHRPPSPKSTPPPSLPTVAPPTPSDDRTNSADLRQPVDWVSTVFPLIATVAFAPVFGVVLWLLRRRCRVQQKLRAEKKLSESGTSEDLEPNPHANVLYLQKPRTAHSNRYESGETTGVIPENRKWEFPRHHLRFLGLLGEGCFGQVWKCDTLGETEALVAVKTLKENASEKEKKDLLNELEVMKLLDPHPNVVTLLGCCTDRDPLFLIMEYVQHGKLQTYLRESRAERQYGNLHGGSRHLTSRDLTVFAYHVAKGMEYLSTCLGTVHKAFSLIRVQNSSSASRFKTLGSPEKNQPSSFSISFLRFFFFSTFDFFDFRLSIWELEPRQIPPSHIWHLRVPCAAVLGSVVQEVWPLREGPMAYEEVGSRNTIGSVSIGL